MKKLKVALTLLLVFCCSLGLFACKNDPKEENKGPKNISEVQLSGQKTSFNEGEEFSTEGLKVTVYYQGDDNPYELTADDYEVDSKAYDKSKAGQYIIYVIPKNQPEELTAGGKDNRVKKSYYASVDHSWKESTDGTYQFECSCGAKRNSYSGLEDKITTVGWGNPATLERGGDGKTYPGVKDPIAGENHVSYGSLVAGQSLKLTLQITDLTRDEKPGNASAWDSPLMGIRNGGDGVLPREDGWIIGQAAGYQVPAECNIPVGGGNAAAGTATKDDPLWQVMTDGTSWSAGTAFPNDPTSPTQWSSVVVEYVYQADGVMLMRHTLKKYDGTKTVYTITVNLPKAAYEVCAYGEYCNYTVTAVEFVAGLAIEKYEVTAQPTNLVQPAGKLFDTTGLKTKATFSDKSTLEDNFNAYAYRNITPEATDKNPSPEPVKTRINLATEPLTADMYGFFVEFNGMEAPLSTDIKVVPTVVTGANSTAIENGDEAFESPEVAYDYAVTTDGNGIRLTMSGAAVKATTKQATVLGAEYTHFVAFKLLTNLTADAFDKVTVEGEDNVKVTATQAGTTVDVIVGLKAGFKPFTLKFSKAGEEGDTAVGSVLVDLSMLSQTLTNAVAEITETNFKFDVGGTYTVKYSGLSDVENLTLATANARDTVAEVKAEVKGTYNAGTTPTRDQFYRVSNTLFIVGIESDTSSVTVTYWFAAPDLANLIASQVTTTVSIRNGDTVLASANLIYNFETSDKAANIGTEQEPVYVTVNNNKLIVYAFVSTKDVKDGINFPASLNIEHTYVEGQEYKMDYNVGVTIKNGAAAWLDENVLTLGDSTPKLIALGTVNNTNDYDKGAILVASLHLPNIGVRESDNEATFRFTGNENTVSGQEKYMIFTVTKNTIAGVDTAPSGSRTTIQNGSCVTDGVEAYKTEDGFIYGALITPATGAHEWKEEVDNVAECEKCGATKTKVVKDGSTYEYTLLSEENMSSFTNTAVDGWWGADNKIGTQQLGAGNFAIKYVWDQLDANYCADGALTFIGTTTEGAELHKRFLEPATDATNTLPGGAIKAGEDFIGAEGTISYKILDKDGNEVTFDQDFAAFENGMWLGKYEVTAVRLGTTLYVYEKVVTKVESGESRTFTSELVVTEFTTEALTVCLWGNPYWCGTAMKVNVGVVAATANNSKVMTFGHALGENEQPEEGKFYSFHDWYDLPNLKDGMTITAFGSQTGQVTENWFTLLWEMKDGWTGRLDNYGWSFPSALFGDKVTEQSNKIEPEVQQPDPEGVNFWAKYKEIARNCDWTITFKLSGRVVTVDIVLTGADAVYTQNYKLTASSVPEAGLGIHLTGEDCTVTFKGYTVS